MEQVIENSKKEVSYFKKCLFEALFYFGLFVFALISYLLINPLYGYIRNGIIAQSFGALLLVCIFIAGVVLKKLNKLTIDKILFLFVLAGFVLRLTYILYTPGNARQHDTWTDYNDGHFSYAEIIYSTGKLPTTNDYQFYHPPLNALIEAGFMHFFEGVTYFVNHFAKWLSFNEGMPETKEAYFSACQLLTLMYSSICMSVAIKIFKRLNIKDFGLILSSALICFFPRFIQLSGQLNNDMICIMNSFLALLFTLKWWQKKNFTNIILTAVFIGLAMMSKLSGATICLTTAIIFIYEFVKSIRENDKKKLGNICLQYVVFLLICAPLGLWFQVYAKVRFDQPFAYVFGNLNSALSVANHNVFERFFFPLPDSIFYDIFAHAFNNYNLFDYSIKSSIFGEFSFWQGECFAFLAVLFNYIYVILLVICIVVFLKVKKFKENFTSNIFLLSLLAGQVFSQLYFNIKMPYGCTMDFRYIVPITLANAGLVGIIYNQLNLTKKQRALTFALKYAAIVFVVCSSLFYMVAI